MRQAAYPYHLFVGIDVSADTCTMATRRAVPSPMRAATVAQTPAGFAAREQCLLALEPDPTAILVVMEATGTYWMRLALHLVAAHVAVAVVNPAQAHDFAKAVLKRAKTDAIDACTGAELAARLQPQPWTPPPPITAELHQRLKHRDALVDARTQFRNQLHAVEHQPVVVESVRTRLTDLIATLTAEIATVDQEIRMALEQDEAWATAAAYLASIQGLGTLTIAWVLPATRNFTVTPAPEAAANDVGVVPQVHQSGPSVRGRASIGHSGHARLRHALYMATLSAIQHNPMIKAFYHRLLAKGKPGCPPGRSSSLGSSTQTFTHCMGGSDQTPTMRLGLCCRPGRTGGLSAGGVAVPAPPGEVKTARRLTVPAGASGATARVSWS